MIRRKDIVLIIVSALFFWILLGALVYFFSPQDIWTVVIFFVLLFLATLLTGIFFLRSARRAFLVAVFVTMFLSFRYLGVGDRTNALLLAGFLITLEIYFSSQK